MKLIIDIPEKTIAHIRSNYGHGCKGLYDEDRGKIIDAIYHGIPLDDVKAEIEDLDRFYDNDYFSGNRDSMFKCNEIMKILDNIGKEGEE